MDILPYLNFLLYSNNVQVRCSNLNLSYLDIGFITSRRDDVGVMSLHTFIELLKSSFMLEPVSRCDPKSYQLSDPFLLSLV